MASDGYAAHFNTPLDGARDSWGIAAHQGTLSVAHVAGIDTIGRIHDGPWHTLTSGPLSP